MLMKIWVICKVRKEQDMYQSHTWRLVTGGNVEDDVRAEKDSLIKRLSLEEIRVGWTYEMTPIEATIKLG